MSKIDVTERLTFIAKNFNVFKCGEEDAIDKKTEELEDEYDEVRVIGDVEPLAVLGSTKIIKEDSRGKEFISYTKHVSVCYDVFVEMLEADPTDNKMYLQWMLGVFTRLIKADKINEAIAFACEDLPQAKEYILLFEANKRKKKFKELCKTSYILKHIKDATNINQYKSLSQLFDAVDPFIERDPTEMESLMQRYVNSGHAEIPVRDRKFTLFIPKTVEANAIFHKFSNWCTARPKNTMFDHYTKQRKPNGEVSDIYIIVNNKFFEGESDEIYQIHFESKQIRNRTDSAVDIFENVIYESDGISNFFYEELMGMAKEYKKGIDGNFYIDFLVKFGFTESLFEFIDENTPFIRFMKRDVPKLPDISKFKNLDQLIITDAKMVEVHPSIGKLKNLQMISLTDNKLKALPSEIGNLKNLNFMCLVGNPLTEIPDSFMYLDESKGGSLGRLSVRKEDIGDDNYEKLKRLLPNVTIKSE